MINSIYELNSLAGFDFSGPVAEAQIQEAQKELETTFSDEFIEINRLYGAISFYGHQLTGISPYSGNNVVIVTIEERKNNPNLGNHYYVIEQAHIDGIVLWMKGDGAVYQTYPFSKPVKISNSIIEYINYCTQLNDISR